MSPLPQTILHVDVDAFFASVEQVLNPTLKGKPVVVGGLATDRSVVASASYEARALGIKTAMPIAAAQRICPQATFLRGNYHEYQKSSERIETILSDFSPTIQMVSLDDFYLDMTGTQRLLGPTFAAAERAKLRVRNETGLSVSMGIASNRMMAKIASERAKPNGIVEVRRGYEADFLRPLQVGVLPGVGGKTLTALRQFNLHTVGDLARIDKALLEMTFGPVWGTALWDHAHAIDNAVVAEGGPPKSISRATTFEQDMDDRRAIASILYYLTERAARQLRSLAMQGRCVSVKLRYSDFETFTRSRTLDRPTNHDEEFYRVALDLFEALYTRRIRVRLIGVCLSSFTPSLLRQSDFIDQQKYQKRTRLYGGIDSARDRFGFSIITVGPSLRMLKRSERDENGFKLRTSCLTR